MTRPRRCVMMAEEMAVPKHRRRAVGKVSLWLAFLLVPLLVYLHRVHVLCLVNPFGITTIDATIVDSQHHPIPGAAIDVFDMAHNQVQLGRGTDVAYLSGNDGQISDVYRTQCCYYVQAGAEGYFTGET